MNTIRPAIEELERAFRELSPVFKRNMPLPVITIQSKGRKNALGWFVRDKWSNTNGKLPEINICAEHLARSPEDIADFMQAWLQGGACDGFIMQALQIPVELELFVDQVVPVLQRRGLHRRDYSGSTLRDHLGLRKPG